MPRAVTTETVHEKTLAGVVVLLNHSNQIFKQVLISLLSSKPKDLWWEWWFIDYICCLQLPNDNISNLSNSKAIWPIVIGWLEVVFFELESCEFINSKDVPLVKSKRLDKNLFIHTLFFGRLYVRGSHGKEENEKRLDPSTWLIQSVTVEHHCSLNYWIQQQPFSLGHLKELPRKSIPYKSKLSSYITCIFAPARGR